MDFDLTKRSLMGTRALLQKNKVDLVNSIEDSKKSRRVSAIVGAIGIVISSGFGLLGYGTENVPLQLGGLAGIAESSFFLYLGYKLHQNIITCQEVIEGIDLTLNDYNVVIDILGKTSISKV